MDWFGLWAYMHAAVQSQVHDLDSDEESEPEDVKDKFKKAIKKVVPHAKAAGASHAHFRQLNDVWLVHDRKVAAGTATMKITRRRTAES